MTLVALEAWHLLDLRWRLQPSQAAWGVEKITPEYAVNMVNGGPGWTLLDPFGAPTACGGFFTLWEGRALAWAFLAGSLSMVAVHRAAVAMLAAHGIRRVEAWVDANFQEGHRWARMLGFNLEGRMARFSPEGADMDLYARVS